jgi:hypothetical protein
VDLPNIPDIWTRCKASLEPFLSDWGLVLVVFLVAFSSFGLGRLSATEAAKPVVSVSQAPMEEEGQGMAIGGLVVASRTGSVYHFPWCSGALQIKAENRIWFKTEETAQNAGYTPSKSCKGLGSE